jgi:hypothetical protein
VWHTKQQQQQQQRVSKQVAQQQLLAAYSTTDSWHHLTEHNHKLLSPSHTLHRFHAIAAAATQGGDL